MALALGLLLAAFLAFHAVEENRIFDARFAAALRAQLERTESWLSNLVERRVDGNGERAAALDGLMPAGVTAAFVLDRRGTLLSADRADRPAAVGVYAPEGLQRLAAHARQTVGKPSKPASGAVLLDGVPHLAAAAPLSTGAVLAYAIPLDEALAPLAGGAREAPHVVTVGATDADRSLPLTDIDGRPLAHVAWTMPRPADILLTTALPVLLAVTAVAGIVAHRLGGAVRRRLRALEAENAALAETERRYRALMRAAPVGLFRTDAAGACTFVNERGMRFARPADAGGDGLLFLRRVHPDDHARVLVQWQDAVALRQPFRAEFRTTAGDGEACWVAVEAQPRADGSGFLGSIADITALKRAQETLAGREEFLRVVAHGVPALIGYVDAARVFRFHNARLEEWYGLPASEVTGRTVREVVGEPLHSRLKPHLDAVLAGRPFAIEERVALGRGPERILALQGMPHRNGRGEVVGCFLLASDATERRRIETDLKEARDRAETANRSKSRFFAAASHDLRQPLHALGLFLDLLAAGALVPAQRELLERARHSFQGTEELLNQLLDISRLEAGTVEPNVAAIDLVQMCERLDSEIRLEAEAKGLSLRFHPLPEAVASDFVLLERILRNLLLNAVRYTEGGGVLLACRRRGDCVRLEVWDTGAGIPPEQVERIFEEFYQVGNAERDARRGLGLGLAIVSRLARLLGHDIEVRSIPGKGSRFAITVPLAGLDADAGAPVPAVATVADADAALMGLRVAIVDDNPHALEALRHFLLALGIEPVAAESGEGLMTALAAGGGPPAAVLADLRLAGGVDGTEVIAEVRRRYGDSVPGVLLTGDTAPERVRQAVDSGYVLLHKPVRPATLIEVLHAVLLPAPAHAA